MSARHRNVELVESAVIEAGIEPHVAVLDSGVHTAELAAAALGCEVGAIANSLIFAADGKTLLVMASGGRKVDTAVVARGLGVGEVRRATPEQVRTCTGQVIGGVAPVGHPAPIRTVIDPELAGYDVVWSAAGVPAAVMRLTYADLVRLTGGQELTVR